MTDLIVVLMTLAFFGLCHAYVRWCDRIIGPDDIDDAASLTVERELSPLEPEVPHGEREVVR